MAIYYWSLLNDGDVFGGGGANPPSFYSFDDELNFDDAGISAAAVSFQFVSGVSSTFSYANKTVTLNIWPEEITTTNITFADGSVLIVGDSNNGISNDSLDNTLTGGAGDDQLVGLGGDDTLDGGAGADLMFGGAGHDTYIVDDAGDAVIESLGAGLDQVQSGVAHTLAANVEDLILTGTADINGSGNTGPNTLTGNEGANQLDGAAGADVLLGGLGNDTLTGESATPVFAIVRASTDSSGAQANGIGNYAGLSADGRYVTFASSAADLVTGDTNGQYDIFVKDLQTGTTTRVSTDSAGAEANSVSQTAVISADGRYVAFDSLASNLVAGDMNGKWDIFVKDLQTGSTTRVSTDSSGAEATDHVNILAVSISADGRYVAFETAAANLVAGDTNGWVDIFVKDLVTGTTTRVSTDSVGAEANSASQNAALSADGRYVAFTSGATNLVAGDTNGIADVFIKDMQTGATTRVSTNSSGAQATGAGGSARAALSADGRYVAFESFATNLVAGDTNSATDIFVKDLQTGITTRVSTSSSGVQANSFSSKADISADGRYAIFETQATNLVAGDTNSGTDIFVKDLLTGTTTRVSVNSSGAQSQFVGGFNAAISADGRYVAFESGAPDLVAGDTNNAQDIFVASVLAIDYLQGGTGDDTYVIGSSLDVITDSAGTDTAQADVSYTLSAAIEHLTLTGADSINGTGNPLDNLITGNSAANRLDGLAGADTLAGAAGDDTYVVDSAGDVVTELSLGGVDQIESSITYTLPEEVENLLLTGTDSIGGSGNTGNNFLTGNGAANTLDGGSGDDSMAGGMGNDSYVVDSASDVVTETALEGVDRIEVGFTYTLPAEVENLLLTGSAAINGTGNDLANIITGNSGDNVLDGGAGADSASYAAPMAGYQFGVNGNGQFTITDIDTVTGGNDGTDTLIDVEQASFGDGTVSLTVDGERRVNTYTANSQSAPAVAALSDGGWVVTWDSAGQDGSGDGIYAQRYAANGAIVGDETLINTTTANSQSSPAVSALSDGGWVVTWDSAGQDGSGDGIYAQRYAANGAAAGGETRVNTTTANNQLSPAVAALADGGWVVTWTSVLQDGSGEGIYAQRYAANGTAAGGETRVNTTTVNNQLSPAVAALSDGGWVVTWTSVLQDGSGEGIYAQRYAANGAAVGSETRVNTTTASNQTSPAVAALADGGWVATWQSNLQDGSFFGIYAQRYAANGAAAGGETLVNTATANNQLSPAVAALADGGWVVAWRSNLQDGSGYGVYAQRYDANGATVGGETLINTTTANDQISPAVTALADGGWVVTWQGGDIYAQRFNSSGTTVKLTGDSGDNTLVWSGTTGISLDGGAGNDALTGGSSNDRLDGGPDPGDDTLAGGAGDDTYVVNSSADVVTESAGTDTVRSSATFTIPAGVEYLVLTGVSAIDGTGNELANVITGNSAANTLDGGAGDDILDGGASSDTLIGGTGEDKATYIGSMAGYQFGANSSSQITVIDVNAFANDGTDTLIDVEQAIFTDGTVGLRAYGETRINTTTANNQFGPAASAVSDGGWVVTWQSILQDGSDYGIYAQRYAANGAAVGGETLINTTTVNDQISPATAALSDGGWVVTWQSNFQDDSFYGIYAQRYAANGATVGGETRVNTYTTSSQEFPAVTALADGGWVVTWSSLLQDGSGSGVYAQRYAANGATVGGETRINTTTVNDQRSPAIAALSDGGWVVTWESLQDGSGSGVYAQRYDASGASVGGETRVNTTTASNQSSPAVAALSDGGWAVTWQSDLQDGSGDGIYTQRYAANGATVGGETSVNTYTTSDQEFLAVTSLSDGGWVVTWSSLLQDGSGYGLYAQRFDANGNTVKITGDAGDNTLIWSDTTGIGLDGGDGKDHLDGGSGNDRLDGGSGNDTMAGWGGDDTYIVDSALDAIQEAVGGGIYGAADVVLASVTYTLAPGAGVEYFTLTGSSAINGTGNEFANVITGNSAANMLDGGVSNDTLSGGAGNDTLNGGTGSDSLAAGTDDDTYVVDSEADVVTELTGGGTDTIRSPLATTILVANVERLVLLGTTALEGFGNSLDNHITGNVLANLLDGGAGADTMEGGKGDDSYQVDNSGDVVVEANSSGNDVIETIVTYSLPNFVENLTLLGTAALNGTGNFLSNILVGNTGDNVLDGGLNDDIMIGGPGNDVYKVDNPNDLIIENPNEGIDRVDSTISYDLSANVENLTLENIDNVTLLGNGNHDATGNELANVLTGNTGHNLLDGRGEDDTLIGGLGNDSYIVEQAGDVVTELPGQGTDLVRTTLTSYTLGSDFENLTLEAGAVSGTGNELDNIIIGNDSDNSLVGSDGDDTLDGGPGADTMVGGDGNDRYDVDNAGDVIIELPDQGQDAVFVDFSDGAAWNNNYHFALPANVEDAFFDFISLGQITEIVGNALDNLLQGNDGQNVLDGGGGNDTLQGGGGDDTYVVGEAGDLVLENGSAGIDTVQSTIDHSLGANVENLQLLSTALQGIGNALNNQIVGNAGNNVLDDGGAGADTLSGGAGNDLYVVHNSIVVLDETGGSGHDTVQTYANLQLAAGLEDAILAGFDNLNVQGNSLGNLITSNTGNNLIDGASGIDRVSYAAAVAAVNVNLGNAGGLGQGTGGGGADILIAIEGMLGSNFNDTLTAGTGDNILDGGLGTDTMTGGTGSDTYYVDSIGDVVVETSNTPPGGLVLPGGGGGGFKPGLLGGVLDSITDTVIASISYSLENLAYVERLSLTGDATTATGNELANALEGNELNNVLLSLGGNDTVEGLAGNDTLDGGRGMDSMTGGGGDDSYYAGATGTAGGSRIVFVPDAIVEAADGGSDTVYSSTSFALSAQVENLVLTGAPGWRAYTGTGNDLGNVIEGLGVARHQLYGKGGDDTLIGGDGRDVLDGEAGSDVLLGSAGDDVLVWDALDTSVQGGGGEDTLRVDGSGVILNLAGLAGSVIQDVEVIDLTGAGNNSLTLTLADVLANSSTTETLRVDGNTGDVVNAGSGWVVGGDQVIGSNTYHSYTQLSATLFIDTDVTQNVLP